ncbi:hypothetical protein V2H45_00270 [Tumidithrix elongata RA019]|uniref:Glycosyl transferase n=1 Tax=Tumidithrix elongata BACA0141 TaxID=2716417 RepID=A0AAW9PSC3_9CYAN|nr:hypothetical protein [Tumidithrix elongata RA019]
MKKVKNSFAFRSGGIYRFLVKLFPPPYFRFRPKAPILFLSMCGYKHLDLLQQSLQSLHQSWTVIPKLQIYSDGTVKVNEIERMLLWWKGEKKISSWETCFLPTSGLDSKILLEFARSNPVGRKLAVILHHGRNEPTLWCDTDILWFSQLPCLQDLLQLESDLVLKTSSDYQSAYGSFVDTLPHLNQYPYINTGIVYLNGDLLNKLDLDNLLKKASNFSDHFTEQAILAEAVFQVGLPCWSIDEIFCGANDNQTLAITYESKPWIARHYTGLVRHLFWRDTLALKLGIKREKND